MNSHPAKLVDIIDGDTVVLSIYDEILDTDVNRHVRLAGLNAGKGTTADGVKATEFVTRWFARHGGQVFVHPRMHGKHSNEKYGRLLADISAGDGKTDLNDALLASGYAAFYDGHGPKPVPHPRASS